MSHGASPSPWWTVNAIWPTAERRAFAAEVAATSATSASVGTTATHAHKLPKLSTGLLCASAGWLPRPPEVTSRKRAALGPVGPGVLHPGHGDANELTLH